ncbi:MAG: deoxyribonuclease IV [Candidatus Micrarchaeia archaeon]
MENTGGTEGKLPYNKKTIRKLITALEEMWKEASLKPGNETGIDYAALSEIAKATGYLLEATVLSKVVSEAGKASEYELLAQVSKGKVGWQLTGKDSSAESEALPGPSAQFSIQYFKFECLILLMIRVGHHVSIAGRIDLSFDRTLAIGGNTMQIFVTNPRGWAMQELGPHDADFFREKGKERKVYPIIAHMPYLPNLASPKDEGYKKSVKALQENMQRCEELGMTYLVAHMGSSLGENKEKSLERVANAALQVLDYKCMLLLENEAGQKNSIGSDLNDLSYIYDKIGSKRIGFCFDTCHAFASGYDIRDPSTIELIESTIGIEEIRAIHLNDAKYPLGSRLDRHANIGFGYIGIEGFRTFLGDKKLASKPLILETPMSNEISPSEEIRRVRGIIEDKL